MEWIAASEGDKVQRVINEITEQVRKLGPLELEPMSIMPIPRELAIEPAEDVTLSHGGTP